MSLDFQTWGRLMIVLCQTLLCKMKVRANFCMLNCDSNKAVNHETKLKSYLLNFS